jgi:hypothetical protein
MITMMSPRSTLGTTERPAKADSNPAVQEFANAMSAYRESSGRLFPTWCEVLEVLVGLGYRKAL